uniref:Uncharacterized protein n=1 Tax=Leersia perrieri TaxID=77586 RepID=A0A0D9W357_9ORYZ
MEHLLALPHPNLISSCLPPPSDLSPPDLHGLIPWHVSDQIAALLCHILGWDEAGVSRFYVEKVGHPVSASQPDNTSKDK